VLETFGKVEAMDIAALEEGLGREWGFESYTEYLDAVESRGLGINVAGLVGHSAIRLSARDARAGQRAARGERRHAVVHDADSPGVGRAGGPAARRRPQRLLGRAVHAAWQPRREPRVSPARTSELVREGMPLFPLMACRPVMFECTSAEPTVLANWSVLQRLREAVAPPQLRAAYADPELRRRLRGVVDGTLDRNGDPGDGPREERVRLASFALIELSWYAPEPTLEGRSLAEIARQRGCHPVDTLFDLGLASGLEGRFRIAMANYDEDELAGILQDPNVVLGLGDGGAHMSQPAATAATRAD